MAKDEQIDRLSKIHLNISPEEKKFAKREHRRYLRRLRKKIDEPNPKHNRYSGWIG